ncbi:MAG: helix-turn-helix domain-containing protein [Oscillospiraceae bacterium]|nr:helix-turn-helix domain-containing protein [Oscillospiraceae bacterium]
MGKNFRETLNERLKDPQFKREYDALEPEFQIIQALIDGRKEKNLTQKQLSELTGINQADISKLEKGNANPSIRTLQRLAAGMDMSVKIEFIPNHNSLI